MRDGVCRRYSLAWGAMCLSCLLACLLPTLQCLALRCLALPCLASPFLASSCLTFLVNLPADRTAGQPATTRICPSLLFPSSSSPSFSRQPSVQLFHLGLPFYAARIRRSRSLFPFDDRTIGHAVIETRWQGGRGARVVGRSFRA